jgi:hypothetical protein
MPEHDNDIIAKINEVTEPGPDAATWTEPQPETEHTTTITAIYLGIDSGDDVELSRDDALGSIAELLDRPTADLLGRVGDLVWWGNGEARTAPQTNIVASRIYHDVLHSIDDGTYAASDVLQAHARDLLVSEHERPTLFFGPCVITGVDDAGAPAPLDENFLSWEDGLAAAAEQRQYEFVRRTLEAAGIVLDTDDVLIVGFRRG